MKTGASCQLPFVFIDNPVQNKLKKVKKSSKIRQNRKILYTLVRNSGEFFSDMEAIRTLN